MTEREKLEQRLLWLDGKIAAAKQWGAILTAAEEERRYIKRQPVAYGESADKPAEK